MSNSRHEAIQLIPSTQVKSRGFRNATALESVSKQLSVRSAPARKGCPRLARRCGEEVGREGLLQTRAAPGSARGGAGSSRSSRPSTRSSSSSSCAASSVSFYAHQARVLQSTHAHVRGWKGCRTASGTNGRVAGCVLADDASTVLATAKLPEVSKEMACSEK